MNSSNIAVDKKVEIEINETKSKNIFENIKSKFILYKIFNNLQKKKLLGMVKFNKNLKERINININDYKEYYELIEIEIIPVDNKYGKFINIKKGDEKYYHIYFNNNKKEIKRQCVNENEQIKIIKIIIDYPVNSFMNLFKECELIESIKFQKFNRNNINNMNSLFLGCLSLKELNLNHFNTNNVIDMSYMFGSCILLQELNLNIFNTTKVTNMKYLFSECHSLKSLNLSNFNTKNVTDMSLMFHGCSSLKELNLNSFNTKNVTDMSFMFQGCSSLKELNLNSFNTIKVIRMNNMFSDCSALKILKIDNFNFDKVKNMDYMFAGCSDKIIKKMKNHYKILKEEAFKNFKIYYSCHRN